MRGRAAKPMTLRERTKRDLVATTTTTKSLLSKYGQPRFKRSSQRGKRAPLKPARAVPRIHEMRGNRRTWSTPAQTTKPLASFFFFYSGTPHQSIKLFDDTSSFFTTTRMMQRRSTHHSFPRKGLIMVVVAAAEVAAHTYSDHLRKKQRERKNSKKKETMKIQPSTHTSPLEQSNIDKVESETPTDIPPAPNASITRHNSQAGRYEGLRIACCESSTMHDSPGYICRIS